MSHEKRIRAAALFVLVGLLVQLTATLYWTPLSFVLFTILGVPLVVLGVVVYLSTVWKILKERKAL